MGLGCAGMVGGCCLHWKALGKRLIWLPAMQMAGRASVELHTLIFFKEREVVARCAHHQGRSIKAKSMQRPVWQRWEACRGPRATLGTCSFLGVPFVQALHAEAICMAASRCPSCYIALVGRHVMLRRYAGPC